MSKTTVTRLFVGSLLAIVGGLVLAFIAAWVGYAPSAFVMNGPDVIGVQPTSLGWTAVGVGIIAILAILGGVIGQFVAWIGAVLTTAQVQDKSWFLVLLLLGLFSFGFIAMLFYVVAGPDGTQASAKQPSIQARPTAAPTGA
jgi:H+/Cl- antiporter ClcA